MFPNAVVRADKRDADFWLAQKTLDAAPKDEKGFIEGAMASLKPYVDAGKFKAFEGDAELVPGVKAVATHGHTPGHAIYVVESKSQKLVLWGDLMHVAAVQFQTRRDDRVRHRQQGGRRAAQEGLCRRREGRLLGRRLPPAVPGHRTSALGRQRLRFRAGELLGAALGWLDDERGGGARVEFPRCHAADCGVPHSSPTPCFRCPTIRKSMR